LISDLENPLFSFLLYFYTKIFHGVNLPPIGIGSLSEAAAQAKASLSALGGAPILYYDQLVIASEKASLDYF